MNRGCIHSLVAGKPQYIGQAGLGNKEEFGQLSLEPDENFCMGGPGVLFSRETLRRMIPHVANCLKHLYSTHEDVEVGRCVRRHVGIPCTWSYEVSRFKTSRGLTWHPPRMNVCICNK